MIQIHPYRSVMSPIYLTHHLIHMSFPHLLHSIFPHWPTLSLSLLFALTVLHGMSALPRSVTLLRKALAVDLLQIQTETLIILPSLIHH